MEIHIGKRVADISLIRKEGNKVEVSIDGQPIEVDVVMAENGSCSILHDGHSYNAELKREDDGKHYEVNMFYRAYPVEIVDTQARYLRMKQDGGERQAHQISAPMPGKVIKIWVKEGDLLAANDTVVIIEAMKMQNNIKVSEACTVEQVKVQEGDTVEANQILIRLNEPKNNPSHEY